MGFSTLKLIAVRAYGLSYNLSTQATRTVKIQAASMTNRSILGVVVGVLAFSLAYYGVQRILFPHVSFNEELMSMAKTLNKTCPIRVDQSTQLDNAIALPDNVFQYNYTLLNITKAEVNLDTMKKYFEPGVVNRVRTNPDMKIFRDNRATVNYTYNDMNGVFIFKIVVTPDMYDDERIQ